MARIKNEGKPLNVDAYIHGFKVARKAGLK
jgi:hypothetical protein